MAGNFEKVPQPLASAYAVFGSTFPHLILVSLAFAKLAGPRRGLALVAADAALSDHGLDVGVGDRLVAAWKQPLQVQEVIKTTYFSFHQSSENESENQQ